MPKGYIAPDAGPIVKFSHKAVKAGDGGLMFGATLSTVMITVLAVPALAIEVSAFFLFLVIPLLICLGIWAVHGTNSYHFGVIGNDDAAYGRAYKAYQKTIGDHTNDLAKPIIEKVFQHAKDKHNGQGSSFRDYKDCGPCAERLSVLEQLVPERKAVNSKEDIELARQFLAARKELTGA